jgi:hypothetical protein
MAEQTAFPLAWPPGTPRTPHAQRRAAAFGSGTTTGEGWRSRRPLTTAEAVARLHEQMRLLGVDAVISTNLPLRRDGIPRSDQAEPADPGVAVYFRFKGKAICMPCDTWLRVADNLAAIAKHIEAMRGMERWGVGSLERAFTGYLALPAAIAPPRPWRQVLGMHNGPATPDAVEGAYKRLVKTVHPDAGGSSEQLAELNRARDEARRELAGVRP